MSLIRHRYATILSLIVVSTLVVGCAQQATTPPVAQDQDAGDHTASTSSPSVETAPQALASQPAPEPATQPVAPPKPRFVTVSIPAGTEIEIELLDALSTGVNQPGDPVRGRLTQPLYADGRLVASAGAQVTGTVAEVVPLKKFGGQPKLSMTFDRMATADGTSAAMMARFDAAGTKQAARDAAKIGGGAAAGAIIGHQVDDDKGKEIGALIGGAIGAVAAAKTGKELELATGTLLVVPIESEMRVRLEN